MSVAKAQSNQETTGPNINLFGVPGLLDTPIATPMDDGDMVFAMSRFAGMTRYNFTAQVHPRIAGTFRYTSIQDFDSVGFSTYYDRSFDLRFTLLQETAVLPTVTMGLQDFIGTGIYGAEYVVVTKSLTPKVRVTGGLGWGRLAGTGPLGGFGDRPRLTPEAVAEGGEPNLDQLFRGDIGYFGGLEWQPLDQLRLAVEYASDQYDLESGKLDIFERRSPWNFGAIYEPWPGTQLSAYNMYGTEFGLSLSFTFNPNKPAHGVSLDQAPPPVLPRPPKEWVPAAYATDWAYTARTVSTLREQLAEALLEQRLELVALETSATEATVYFRNSGYVAMAQALGRTGRTMTRLMPSSVEHFTLVPMVAGQPMPAHSFRRTDLELFDVSPLGTEEILNAAAVSENPSPPSTDDVLPGLYPEYIWRVSPYIATSFFDPDDPLRADFGAEVAGIAQLSRGLFISGAIRKRIVGSLDEADADSDSVLPRVRSDFARYDQEGDPGISNLTGAFYLKPRGNLYGRVTAGYLERMFAGVSTEILWAPFDSPWAFGVDLNYVRQRDYDGGFGLLDYDVVTGHASAYYQISNNYRMQVDVGQYLAGDRGATLSVERTFANGWSVGAFATFTNVSAEEFGEGSFDKGITLNIPFSWFTGRSNRVVEPLAIRPIQRDGGAMLDVEGRLFELVNQGRRHRVEEQWGRFWR